MDQIYNVLKKEEESHKIIIYLSELGFPTQDAIDIYNIYKENTINIINNNIYSISEKIENIPFLKLDQIAQNMNIPKDDEKIEEKAPESGR